MLGKKYLLRDNCISFVSHLIADIYIDCLLMFMRKEELYKTIKVVGMVSYIPLILAACPLAGFFAGEYLQKKFSLPGYTVIAFVLISFIAGILETIKTIKKVNRIVLK
jgi:hypothetical protein